MPELANPAVNEIHLFQASVAGVAVAAQRLAGLLTPDERRQLRRYRTADRRQSLVAGRVLVRCILAEFLGVAPEAVGIRPGQNGKPYLTEPVPAGPDSADDVTFSIAHSADQLVIAITTGEPVGVDVEDYEQDLNQQVLLDQYFTAAEQAAWNCRVAAVEPHDFLRGWTRKEAAWKVFGDPQRVAWREIDIAWGADTRTSVSVVDATATETRNSRSPVLWDCWTWNPSRTSVASAVVPSNGQNSRTFLCRSIGLSATGQLV